MLVRDTFCSFCGTKFEAVTGYPRSCSACGNVTYRNPLPVAVTLLPVGEGLLVIRRNIEPRLGQIALPGGFIELGESWQAAAARELWEETGLTIASEDVTLFDVKSAPDGTVLIFALAKGITPNDLPDFTPNSETQEIAVISAPEQLGFPLHTQVVEAYFGTR